MQAWETGEFWTNYSTLSESVGGNAVLSWIISYLIISYHIISYHIIYTNTHSVGIISMTSGCLFVRKDFLLEASGYPGNPGGAALHST